MIYHGCGNVNRVFEDFIEVGVDAYNPLEAKAGMDVVELRRKYGHRMAFCGNLDALTWATGTMDELKTMVLTKLNGPRAAATSSNPITPSPATSRPSATSSW